MRENIPISSPFQCCSPGAEETGCLPTGPAGHDPLTHRPGPGARGPTTLLSPMLLSVPAGLLPLPPRASSFTSCHRPSPLQRWQGLGEEELGHMEDTGTFKGETPNRLRVKVTQAFPVALKIRAPGPPRPCCYTRPCKPLKAKSVFFPTFTCSAHMY